MGRRRLRWLRLMPRLASGHQFLQVIAPDRGVRVCAMAGSLFGYREQDISSFRYFLYGGFHDLHFGWIDFVVGGVDGVEDAFYLSQVGFGVVIAGGVEGIDHVIRIL